MRKLLFIMFILCTIKCVGKGGSHHVVTATYYNSVESQCGSNPLITADGSKINLKKLKEGKLRWIAISRDLRENYKYGDIVIIESDDYRLSGEWIVRDTMNSRFKMRIDFLTHDKEFMKEPKKVKIRKK